MAEDEAAASGVDVAKVMREIRAAIAQKRELGLYTDEEVDSTFAFRLRAWAEPARLDPFTMERLLAPSHDWNIAADYLVRSHRPGLAARLSVLAKRAVRPFVRLYTDHIVGRQLQINLYLFHLLRQSVHEVTRLEVEMKVLRRRLETLEAGSGEHSARR